MMFKLVLFPDGRAILMLPPNLYSRDRVDEIREVWKEWRETPAGLMIVPGEVEHATTVEIDLPVGDPLKTEDA